MRFHSRDTLASSHEFTGPSANDTISPMTDAPKHVALGTAVVIMISCCLKQELLSKELSWTGVRALEQRRFTGRETTQERMRVSCKEKLSTLCFLPGEVVGTRTNASSDIFGATTNAQDGILGATTIAQSGAFVQQRVPMVSADPGTTCGLLF
jgi:hypothetical protein